LQHFMLDSYNSFRTRLEDVTLIYEILQRIPYELGVKTVMPPMVLPYFDGFVPEDCGISAFVFLKGGHFTIHTFSFRECYFVDFVYNEKYDHEKLINLITRSLPTDRFNKFVVNRDDVNEEIFPKVDKDTDFGPHVFMETEFKKPLNMDWLFETFDELPEKIDMTPIMRPYVAKNVYKDGFMYSAMTMIAESHISLHYFDKTKKGYFDIFSCKFFDEDFVIPKILEIFGQEPNTPYTLISRGSKYRQYGKTTGNKLDYSRQWVVR